VFKVDIREELGSWSTPASDSDNPSAISTVIICAYVPFIAVAELVGALVGVLPGALCDAILIPVLLSHYALTPEKPHRRILAALALIPLLDLLSFTMPVKPVPQIYWYILVGTPLLIAAALTARLLALSWSDVGLRLRQWPRQILIAASGLPLGLVAFLILRPKPLFAEPTWPEMAASAVVLIVFTGLIEEIIFRGVLQTTAEDALGPMSVLYSSTVFAIAYVGSLSLPYVLFMQGVGLLFGWCFRRTGSIWGTTLAHGLLNIGLIVFWPYVLH
jgi:uncharacterized protein